MEFYCTSDQMKDLHMKHEYMGREGVQMVGMVQGQHDDQALDDQMTGVGGQTLAQTLVSQISPVTLACLHKVQNGLPFVSCGNSNQGIWILTYAS